MGERAEPDILLVSGRCPLYDYAGEPDYGYFREPYTYGGQFKDLGLFAEDVIRPNDRLTLSLGIRFDRNQAISQDIPGRGPTGEELSTDIPGLGDLFTWTNVSPRLGFNFKLTDDGKTLLRGNYGRFVQGMITGELSTVHPGLTPTTLAFFDPETGGYTDIVSVTDPVANLSVNPDTVAPHTDQVSIGFDRELAPDIGIGMTYVYKKGQRLYRLHGHRRSIRDGNRDSSGRSQHRNSSAPQRSRRAGLPAHQSGRLFHGVQRLRPHLQQALVGSVAGGRLVHSLESRRAHHFEWRGPHQRQRLSDDRRLRGLASEFRKGSQRPDPSHGESTQRSDPYVPGADGL